MASTGKKAKIGRPLVESEAITLRLHVDLIKRLDDFRRGEDDIPNRQEAIRRLLEKALKK